MQLLQLSVPSGVQRINWAGLPVLLWCLVTGYQGRGRVACGVWQLCGHMEVAGEGGFTPGTTAFAEAHTWCLCLWG